MTGIMKAQIDWIPLSLGAVRPTQGKTLAAMQVCGGSQSFNAVNQLRLLGRWMRMITIPNQSSVGKAYEQFDEAGRMKPSPYYDRIVDVMEELMKFTLLTPRRIRISHGSLQRAQRSGRKTREAIESRSGSVRTGDRREDGTIPAVTRRSRRVSSHLGRMSAPRASNPRRL
jgi:hypothetical protein